MAGFKSVEIRRDDTLQRIALRELGNALRWVDIAHLNNLHPPYIVNEQANVGANVAYPGRLLLVPIEIENPVGGDTYDQFLTDIAMPNGNLQITDGDWDLISGVPNFSQAIKMRVDVTKRSLWFHPEYGCWVKRLLGGSNGPASGSVAAFYVKSSILEDQRVYAVPKITAEVAGDSLKVDAIVQPLYGDSVAIQKVI